MSLTLLGRILDAQSFPREAQEPSKSSQNAYANGSGLPMQKVPSPAYANGNPPMQKAPSPAYANESDLRVS